MPTPSHLLFPILENSRFKPALLALSRLELNILQATKNTPMPAIRVKIAIIMSMDVDL
jgi:hypothetical protein